MFKLGSINEELLDEEKSKEWYEKVASRESNYTLEAMFKLGSICEEQDDFNWYVKAARRGHKGSLMELSNMLSSTKPEAAKGFDNLSNDFNREIFESIISNLNK